MSVYSKLGANGRTVIPKVIRKRLGLKPGDTIRYRLQNDAVEIARAGVGINDPFAAFSEWSSEADEKAFAKL